LPLVYDELRKLAPGHMANESPGHTLDAESRTNQRFPNYLANTAAEPNA
jgi:hypothetical protein